MFGPKKIMQGIEPDKSIDIVVSKIESLVLLLIIVYSFHLKVKWTKGE